MVIIAKQTIAIQKYHIIIINKNVLNKEYTLVFHNTAVVLFINQQYYEVKKK